jgi:light-regulated signal transduction histidine kinase (bacteriophytochrome)
MESVEEMEADAATTPRASQVDCIQAGGYLLELSADWIVLRASENIHRLLDESHVTLIDEPLERFVRAQTLHDIRNLFSRLSATTGIARAYRVRLTDEQDLVDIAFQQHEDRVLLEAVPSPADGLGETLSAVGGLAQGLAGEQGEKLLDAAARRMRALTAFDRVTLLVGDSKATSSRTGVPFRAGANATLSDDFPVLVPDSAGTNVRIFPAEDEDSAVGMALLRAPSAQQRAELADRGFSSTMRVPVMLDGARVGEFRLAHTSPRSPGFEVHAAAELFAQLFAMRLEIGRLKSN